MRRMGVVDRTMRVRIVRRCCLRCKFEVGCIKYPDNVRLISTRKTWKCSALESSCIIVKKGSFVHCRGLPALAHMLGGDETICTRLAPRNPGNGTMRHELYTLTDGRVGRYKRRLKR